MTFFVMSNMSNIKFVVMLNGVSQTYVSTDKVPLRHMFVDWWSNPEGHTSTDS